MSIQQSLNYIALHDGARYDSFYTGTDNEIVLKDLRASIKSEEHKQIIIWGAENSGKSHLLQAACHAVFDDGMLSAYFPLSTVQRHGTRVFTGVQKYKLICIDDIETVLGNKEWEEALFHLINQVRDNKQLLFFAARENPRHIHCDLPDLKSRLLWGASYQLKELSDADKAKALKSRANQRGFELGDAVIEYIYKRYPRDFGTLMKILDILDRESLSRKRKVTIPFVKEALWTKGSW